MPGKSLRQKASEVLEQLTVLTYSDLRSRYGRGRWQLVKWLIDPFALVGVYLLMVTFIFYRRPSASGLSLACAIIPFQLVTMSVTNSLSVVKDRAAIIGNMRFSRILLPVSTTLTETFGFATSLVLLGLMMGVYGRAPTFSILWLVPSLAVTVVLGVAVAYATALIGIWAPDLRALIFSFVRALYLIAPGLVTLASIHGLTNKLVRINPLTGLFESMRHAVLYRSDPPAWELLYPLGFAVLMLVIFVPLFRREQVHFAKVIQ